MRPSYTDILFRLLAAWPEARYTVKAMAARFYVGADTEEDLRRHTKPLHGWSGKPVLTEREADAIILVKVDYVA